MNKTKSKKYTRRNKTKRRGGSILAYSPYTPQAPIASNIAYDPVRSQQPITGGLNWNAGWGMKGGYNNTNSALIGSNWTSNPDTWGSNHYPINTFSRGDPQTSMRLNGGSKKITNKHKHKHKYKAKGGNNALNYLAYQGQNIYNSFKGTSPPVNPLPWNQQFTHSHK